MEKILVVDDERGLREVMSIMLKRAGYAVTEASDGEEAIGHVGKEIFDLVITDLRMPKADGMAVCGSCDYGVCNRGFGSRCYETRCVRLPHQAVPGR